MPAPAPSAVPAAKPVGVKDLRLGDKPAPAPTAQADAKPAPPAAQAAAPGGQTMAGAQPVVPANSFDSRWSSFR